MMLKKFHSGLLARFLLIAFSLPSLSYAVTCSKEDIVFYLKQGFTHDQVIQLCAATNSSNKKENHTGGLYDSIVRKENKTATTALTSSSTPQSNTKNTTSKQAGHPDVQTLVLFRSGIQADDVQLTDTQLIYTRNKDCIDYGYDNSTGFMDQACVKTRTSIDLQGLRIVSAKKGLPFLGGSELIVAGNIHRRILNPEVMNARQRNGIRDSYDLDPKELEIPLRSGIDPRQLAERLKQLKQ